MCFMSTTYRDTIYSSYAVYAILQKDSKLLIAMWLAKTNCMIREYNICKPKLIVSKFNRYVACKMFLPVAEIIQPVTDDVTM